MKAPLMCISVGLGTMYACSEVRYGGCGQCMTCLDNRLLFVLLVCCIGHRIVENVLVKEL